MALQAYAVPRKWRPTVFLLAKLSSAHLHRRPTEGLVNSDSGPTPQIIPKTPT
jgi:hypothetical protein